METTRCPACDAAVVLEAASSLVSCPACAVRFLAPGSAAATILTAGAGKEEVAGTIELPASFRERFELGRLLGVGAFGTVYQARDRETGRTLAVKFLLRGGGPGGGGRSLPAGARRGRREPPR